MGHSSNRFVDCDQFLPLAKATMPTVTPQTCPIPSDVAETLGVADVTFVKQWHRRFHSAVSISASSEELAKTRMSLAQQAAETLGGPNLKEQAEAWFGALRKGMNTSQLLVVLQDILHGANVKSIEEFNWAVSPSIGGDTYKNNPLSMCLDSGESQAGVLFFQIRNRATFFFR